MPPRARVGGVVRSPKACASWGALGIVLATTISAVVFKGPLNAMVVAGVIICIAGVVLVNLGTAR